MSEEEWFCIIQYGLLALVEAVEGLKELSRAPFCMLYKLSRVMIWIPLE